MWSGRVIDWTNLFELERAAMRDCARTKKGIFRVNFDRELANGQNGACRMPGAMLFLAR